MLVTHENTWMKENIMRQFLWERRVHSCPVILFNIAALLQPPYTPRAIESLSQGITVLCKCFWDFLQGDCEDSLLFCSIMFHPCSRLPRPAGTQQCTGLLGARREVPTRSESPPLDCKEIKPVNPKGNQSWIFIGRTDPEAETSILWPPDVKNWLIGKDPDAGKDWGQKEKGTTEDEMVGWHHQLNGHECE